MDRIHQKPLIFPETSELNTPKIGAGTYKIDSLNQAWQLYWVKEQISAGDFLSCLFERAKGSIATVTIRDESGGSGNGTQTPVATVSFARPLSGGGAASTEHNTRYGSAATTAGKMPSDEQRTLPLQQDSAAISSATAMGNASAQTPSATVSAKQPLPASGGAANEGAKSGGAAAAELNTCFSSAVIDMGQMSSDEQRKILLQQGIHPNPFMRHGTSFIWDAAAFIKDNPATAGNLAAILEIANRVLTANEKMDLLEHQTISVQFNGHSRYVKLAEYCQLFISDSSIAKQLEILTVGACGGNSQMAKNLTERSRLNAICDKLNLDGCRFMHELHRLGLVNDANDASGLLLPFSKFPGELAKLDGEKFAALVNFYEQLGNPEKRNLTALLTAPIVSGGEQLITMNNQLFCTLQSHGRDSAEYARMKEFYGAIGLESTLEAVEKCPDEGMPLQTLYYDKMQGRKYITDVLQDARTAEVGSPLTNFVASNGKSYATSRMRMRQLSRLKNLQSLTFSDATEASYYAIGNLLKNNPGIKKITVKTQHLHGETTPTANGQLPEGKLKAESGKMLSLRGSDIAKLRQEFPNVTFDWGGFSLDGEIYGDGS
jgi:hypothetical protein